MIRVRTIGLWLLICGTFFTFSHAEMKCAPGKCGGAVGEKIFEKDQHKERRCSVCGMRLNMFPQTKYRAEVKGKTTYYCSIHCLASDIRKGVEPQKIKVTDADTLKYIDAQKAYYVITPGKRGTMTMTSKLAFASKDSAEVFAKQYGGHLSDFTGALKEAEKDFKKK